MLSALKCREKISTVNFTFLVLMSKQCLNQFFNLLFVSLVTLTDWQLIFVLSAEGINQQYDASNKPK